MNRFKVLSELRDSYDSEYRILVEDFSNFESKGRDTIMTAGIFLAGLFVFSSRLGLEGIDISLRLLLSFTVVALIVCVLFATALMRPSDVVDAPYGSKVSEMYEDLLASSEIDQEEHSNTVNELNKLWFSAVKSMISANQKKQKLLSIAQAVLNIAMIAAGATILIWLWGI